MNNDITNDRMAAQGSESVVVFIIGMRINRLFPLRRWFDVARSMPKMLAELQSTPASGLLHAENVRSGLRTLLFIQYWRSFEALEAYARDPNQSHWPAWQEFNRKIGSDGSIGIFHETYVVPAARREAIYVNMPPYGLGAALGLVPAVGSRGEARTRLAAD